MLADRGIPLLAANKRIPNAIRIVNKELSRAKAYRDGFTLITWLVLFLQYALPAVSAALSACFTKTAIAQDTAAWVIFAISVGTICAKGVDQASNSTKIQETYDRCLRRIEAYGNLLTRLSDAEYEAAGNEEEINKMVAWAATCVADVENIGNRTADQVVPPYAHVDPPQNV